MMTDETKLVEKLRNGDRLAFRELVETNKKKVYYLALDLTGNHHDAEDLSQEVFIRAFRGVSKFRGNAKLSSWLYRITVNRYLDMKRKKRMLFFNPQQTTDRSDFEPQAPVLRDNGADPERLTESGLIQVHIKQALQALSARERSVFILRHYHELPLKDIAHMLNVADGTVKSLLFRALEKLRKELAFYRQDLGLEEVK